MKRITYMLFLLAWIMFGASALLDAGDASPQYGINSAALREDVSVFHRQGEQAFARVVFPGGMEKLPGAKPGTKFIVETAFLKGGAGGRSFDEIAARHFTPETGIRLQVTLEHDCLRFDLSCKPAALRQALELVSAYVRRPDFVEGALESVREEYRGFFPQLATEIQAVQDTAVQSYLDGGDRRFVFPSKEEFDALSMDYVKSVVDALLEGAEIDVALFSPHAFEEALAIVNESLEPAEERFGDSSGIQFLDTKIKPKKLLPEKDFFYANEDYNASMLGLHWPHVERIEGKQALEWLLVRVAMDRRLRDLVYREIGPGYGIYIDFRAPRESEHANRFSISVIGVAGREREIEALLREFLSRLMEEGLDGETLEQSRAELLVEWRQLQSSPGYWLDAMQRLGQEPEAFLSAEEEVKILETTSLETLNELVEKRLDPAIALTTRVLPQARKASPQLELERVE